MDGEVRFKSQFNETCWLAFENSDTIAQPKSQFRFYHNLCGKYPIHPPWLCCLVEFTV